MIILLLLSPIPFHGQKQEPKLLLLFCVRCCGASTQSSRGFAVYLSILDVSRFPSSTAKRRYLHSILCSVHALSGASIVLTQQRSCGDDEFHYCLVNNNIYETAFIALR